MKAEERKIWNNPEPKQHVTYHTSYMGENSIDVQINQNIRANPSWELVSITPAFSMADNQGDSAVYAMWKYTGGLPVNAFKQY